MLRRLKLSIYDVATPREEEEYCYLYNCSCLLLVSRCHRWLKLIEVRSVLPIASHKHTGARAKAESLVAILVLRGPSLCGICGEQTGPGTCIYISRRFLSATVILQKLHINQLADPGGRAV